MYVDWINGARFWVCITQIGRDMELSIARLHEEKLEIYGNFLIAVLEPSPYGSCRLICL